MIAPPPDTIHASCVAIRGRGVLIRGTSGTGKSDLALRLIDRGAVLVADDRVIATADGDTLTAAPPAALAGKIEVCGLGIVALDYLASVAVALVVDLTPDPPRMPEPDETVAIAGIALPRVALDPRPVSATIKVELALRATNA